MTARLKKFESVFNQDSQTKNFGRSEETMLEVSSARMIEAAAWLRMEETFRMDILENMSIYEAKGRFFLSYFLRSTSQDTTLVLRTSIPVPQDSGIANHPSVEGIWPHAGVFESEQGPLFGVTFENGNKNPSIIRSLWKKGEYPLRKSYEWTNKGSEHDL